MIITIILFLCIEEVFSVKMFSLFLLNTYSACSFFVHIENHYNPFVPFEFYLQDSSAHSYYRKRKMSGFGHRVYKNYDPRAKVIRKLAEEVFSIVGRDPLIEVSSCVFSFHQSREIFPSIFSPVLFR